MTPVERIPVLGRTGPDLTINEMNLVVDVKSRLEVPKALFFPLMIPFRFDGLAAVRVADLNTLWDPEYAAAPLQFSSKIVRGFLEHMEEWTRQQRPEAVSAVILHRPEMPIGSSVVIIFANCRRRLFEYADNWQYRTDPIPAE